MTALLHILLKVRFIFNVFSTFRLTLRSTAQFPALMHKAYAVVRVRR